MRRLLSIGLALFLILSSVTSVFAREQTVTITLKVAVPVYGKTGLGTLVLRTSGSHDSVVVNWDFVGQIEGKRASSSGQARASWDGTGYTGTITKVKTWSMPGLPAPTLPLDMSFKPGNGRTVVVGILTRSVGWVYTKLVYTGIDRILPPFGGDLAVSATNVTGTDVDTIPRTGEPIDLPIHLVVAFGGLVAGVFGLSHRRLRALGRAAR